MPWIELPPWLPGKLLPKVAGFMSRDSGRAHDSGQKIRQLADTVVATQDRLLKWLGKSGCSTKNKLIARYQIEGVIRWSHNEFGTRDTL